MGVYREVERKFGALLLHEGEETGFFVGGELVCKCCGGDERVNVSQETVEEQKESHGC